MRHTYKSLQPLIEQRLHEILTSEGPTEPRYGWACGLDDVVPDGPFVSALGRTVDAEGLAWAWQSNRQLREWLEDQGVTASDATIGRCLKELVDKGTWVRTRPGNLMDKAYAYRPVTTGTVQ
jgi:hypothetical protein